MGESMVIREILNILKQDEQLTELLQATNQDRKIYMNETSFKGDCIVYTYTPLTNDSVKAQSRIEIDCISTDFERCSIILKRVQDLLLTTGDESATENIIEIIQNGGGHLFDKEIKLHTLKAIFSIKEKVR